MEARRMELMRDSCYHAQSSSDGKPQEDGKRQADAAGGVQEIASREPKRPPIFGRHVTIFGHDVHPRCHGYCVIRMIRKALTKDKIKESKASD